MDDSMIRVSIIMPACNAAATIERAIASALRQTEQRLEVIVIDDASDDGTAAIASRAEQRDRRVRVVHQTANHGPAAARNRGLELARGQWIAPVDADDEIAPERMERMLALSESLDADVVSDNLLLCPTQGSGEGTPMISPAAVPAARWMSAAEFVTGNIGSRYAPRVSYGFMKPLIRRSFLERHEVRYEERNRFGEDYMLSLTCLLNGARWWMTPEPMYHYTVRFGSATDVQSAGDLMRIRTLEEDLLRSHPMVATDPALAAALRQHKSVIEHFYYYRAFTDALKARTITPALQVLLESWGSFRHILTESAMQGPRVAVKALRGGFNGKRPAMRETGTACAPDHSGT